ncbi:histidinol-phosphatase [Xylariaceae sp. FL0804]|nr:histidinol-phosphatase [Xylariaceae sp. FL0804]
MAFTMHSHSGQFCPGHAKDQLEAVVQHAIGLGYTTMGLTEHMPRYALEDLYPEELDDPPASLAALAPRHEAYLAEARRLQRRYADRIHLLIGFEGEWHRAAYGAHVRALAAHPAVDYFIGSLHHVNNVPIDYDAAHYRRAIESVVSSSSSSLSKHNDNEGTGAEADEIGNDENYDVDELGDDEGSSSNDDDDIERGEHRLYARYYDQQLAMLRALRPRVVGHFDLVRLLSARPGRDVRAAWPRVWARVRRNLAFVAAYGGWLECNSSALRKGLAEPYPGRAIAEEWLALGGRFTLSDDSHGIAQLGTNYARALDYLAGLGVASLWTLRREDPHPGSEAEGKARLVEREVSLADVRAVVSKW